MLEFQQGDKEWLSCFFCFNFCFYTDVNCFSTTCASQLVYCSFVCFFAFFFFGPFNQMLLVHRICCVCSQKLFQEPGSDHFSVNFLKKGEIFDLCHSLGSFSFMHHNQSSRSSLSFHLADLLSLFIVVVYFDAGNSLEAKDPFNDTGKG